MEIGFYMEYLIDLILPLVKNARMLRINRHPNTNIHFCPEMSFIPTRKPPSYNISPPTVNQPTCIL